MKACIILPTYNERENLAKLLDTLKDVLSKINSFDMSILVVDDNSPDKTYEIALEYEKKYPFIKLLKRKGKEGLGKAYIAGMKYALGVLNADIIFEMDADSSHDPSEIPNFLSKIQKGYNFVIGSRYIKGGDIPNWPLRRKLISRGGNLLARLIAGINDVKDCTSGYRAINSSLLKKIDLENLNISGYAFQMNLLHEARLKKAKIIEIPIIFLDRREGHSKLTKKDVLEFFINAFRLRFSLK